MGKSTTAKRKSEGDAADSDYAEDSVAEEEEPESDDADSDFVEGDDDDSSSSDDEGGGSGAPWRSGGSRGSGDVAAQRRPKKKRRGRAPASASNRGGRGKGADRKRKHTEREEDNWEEEQKAKSTSRRKKYSESASDSDEDAHRKYDDDSENDCGENGSPPRDKASTSSPTSPASSKLRELQMRFLKEELDDNYLSRMLDQWGSVTRAKEKIEIALALAAKLSKDFPTVSQNYLVQAIAETNGTLEAAYTAVASDVLTPKKGDMISQSWGGGAYWRIGTVLHCRKGKGDWFKVEFELEDGEEVIKAAEKKGQKSNNDCTSEILEVQLPLSQKGVTWNLMC